MAEGFFYDQTVMNDIAEEDMELPTSVAQEVWRNYVNDLGPSAEVTLQIGDIEDFTLDDEYADLFDADDDTAVLDELINEEFKADEREVPYEWRYWEHAVDEFPEVDETNAPGVEVGWVDPDTNQEVV